MSQMIVDESLKQTTEYRVEESTRCIAREILKGWARTSGKSKEAFGVSYVKERLERIFSVDFSEEEINRLCSEAGLVMAPSH